MKDLLPYQLRVHTDVRMKSSRLHCAKIVTTTVGHSIVIVVTDLWRHLIHNLREHGIQCMLCYSRILSELVR